MSLPYSSSTPADDPMKKEECHKAAKAVRNMLEKVSGQHRDRPQGSSVGEEFGSHEAVRRPQRRNIVGFVTT